MPEAVIRNTSPLQYLYQLGDLDLLPRFYQQVTIPPAVVQELVDGPALGVALPVPEHVPWVQVQAPTLTPVWQVASTLGAGEREALALALAIPNALLLLDDGYARRFGRLLGLRKNTRLRQRFRLAVLIHSVPLGTRSSVPANLPHSVSVPQAKIPGMA
jgi:uncharacterized protein